MTEKRFTCHQMIADYSTGEDIDFDFLQELIDEQEQPTDLRMHISDGNKIITYRECVDLLNELWEENEKLKQQLKTKVIVNKQYEEFQRIKQENEKLKHQNELLSDELEQCKAVINKKWSEYLKKKEIEND